MNNRLAGNAFMWKMACFQNPGISNHIEEGEKKRKKNWRTEFEHISLKLFCGLQESGNPRCLDKATRKPHLVSALLWLRPGKGFSRLLIRLQIYFFLSMLWRMRESRHISCLGTVLICCQHSWTSFLLILWEEWMLSEESEQSPLLPQKRNGTKASFSLHQRAAPLNHSGKGVKECSQSPAEHQTPCSTQFS